MSASQALRLPGECPAGSSRRRWDLLPWEGETLAWRTTENASLRTLCSVTTLGSNARSKLKVKRSITSVTTIRDGEEVVRVHRVRRTGRKADERCSRRRGKRRPATSSAGTSSRRRMNPPVSCEHTPSVAPRLSKNNAMVRPPKYRRTRQRVSSRRSFCLRQRVLDRARRLRDRRLRALQKKEKI